MKKFEILKERFPFLESFEAEYDVVSVKKFELSLLERVGSEYYWDGALGETSRYEKYYLILENGGNYEVIETETRGESGSNYAGSQRREWGGRTIGECVIEREVDVKRLVAIVEVVRNYEDWPGQYVNERYLYIYPIKNKDELIKKIEEIKERMKNEVEREIEQALS